MYYGHNFSSKCDVYMGLPELLSVTFNQREQVFQWYNEVNNITIIAVHALWWLWILETYAFDIIWRIGNGTWWWHFTTAASFQFQNLQPRTRSQMWLQKVCNRKGRRKSGHKLGYHLVLSLINISNQKFGLTSVSKRFQAGHKSDVKGKKQKNYYFHFILQFPVKNCKLTNKIIIINKKICKIPHI